jgi:hypothetical protein
VLVEDRVINPGKVMLFLLNGDTWCTKAIWVHITVGPPAPPPPTTLPIVLVGCYADGDGEAKRLPQLLGEEPGMSVEACRDLAAAEGLPYFGECLPHEYGGGDPFFWILWQLPL